MYLYRNKKNGVVIKTTCKVSGKNWGPVEDIQTPNIDDPQKDGSMEEVPDEEIPEDEVPAEKPKPSRRGKK